MKRLSCLMPILLLGCSSMQTATESTGQIQQGFIPQLYKVKASVALPGAGFEAGTAKQLLEMCVELNNQDNRNKPEYISDPNYQKLFKAQPIGWKIIYDSRYPANTEWNAIWRWDGNKPNPNDPKENGFGPFNNAWLLTQSEIDPTSYAVVIRGTVPEFNSILADAFATTTTAYAGIEYPKNTRLPITFATTPKAEVHLGFAYSAFALLFDRQHGILAQLHQLNLKDGIKLTISGHSQGAALATLVHAFLYYAITDPHDRYQLKLKLASDTEKVGNIIQLKSYVFAQPKPGNLEFAEDFAHITKDMAYVINNNLDPVTKAPLSLQTASEIIKGVEEENMNKGSFFDQLAFRKAETLTDFKIKLRNHVGQKDLDLVATKFKKKKADLVIDDYFKVGERPVPGTASSLNYTLAGQLIPVFGKVGKNNLYEKDNKDINLLAQHSLTIYRKLMSEQF